MRGGQATYISSNTTTDCASGPCVLERIVITETAAGTILVYDDTTGGTTTLIASFKASIVEGSYELGIQCANGVQVVTAASPKVTVVTGELHRHEG